MDCQQRWGGYILKALLLLFPSLVFSLQNQAPRLQGCFPLSATPSPFLSSLHCDCEHLAIVCKPQRETADAFFLTRPSDLSTLPLPCHFLHAIAFPDPWPFARRPLPLSRRLQFSFPLSCHISLPLPVAQLIFSDAEMMPKDKTILGKPVIFSLSFFFVLF